MAPFIILLLTAWVVHVVERRTALREVEGSSPRPDQHLGLEITVENVLPFLHKWFEILVFSDRDDNSLAPSPTWLTENVKEPTHFLQRVVNAAPGVAVWPCYRLRRPPFKPALI